MKNDKNVLIVESPSKIKTIKKILPSNFEIVATVGHITRIPRKGINIDVKNNFEPKYEIDSNKKDVVKKIKENCNNSSCIYLATDADREGEAISKAVYDLLNKSAQKKCVRVTFDEITKSKILKSLEEPRSIDMNLVNAQKARQVLDRLIGYKVSPVLWYAVSSGTSAGRVQSVALKFVCERHKEIEKFKSIDYWHIDALLKCKDGEFTARAITKDKDNRYLDKNLSEEDYKQLENAKYKVHDVAKKTTTRNSYPPFHTSELQSACGAVFGWQPTKSMKVAQALYEGGKVSYIRTDSFNISKEAMADVRELIKKSDAAYLPSKPNTYSKKSKATAQEAHECIRPTDVYDKGDDIEGSDERKMYKLIRDRFIACQMKPMKIDTVTCTIKTDTKHTLVARGQTVKFDGWSKVYKHTKTKENILPAMEEKEDLELKDLKKSAHKTKPPPRYTGANLVKKMDKEEIGRPSTQASIVKSLQDKGYVELDKKSKGLLATVLGMKVYEYLEKNFSDFFMDIKYTVSLENKINDIAHGKNTFLGLVEPTYEEIQSHIKIAKENTPKKEPEKTGKKCQICQSDIVLRNGKYGEFYACEDYKECKTIYLKQENGDFAMKKKSTAKKTGKKCHKCKGNIVLRSGQYGDFYACDGWPKCKTIYIKGEDGEFKKK